MTVRGDATATGRLRAPLLVLLDEADCLDASHDRLAQIAAEPVLTTLRSTAIAWVPSWKGVMTITRRLGLLKLNFDQRCVCHFCTKAYYYSAVSAGYPRSQTVHMPSQHDQANAYPANRGVRIAWSPGLPAAASSA